MQIRSTVQPGRRGTKKLSAQYGDRLVCVRYRYDEQRQKRFKTIEVIVEEESWPPPPALRPGNAIVSLRLAPTEFTLRQQVKQGGGRWDPRRQVWEMRYAQAVALGIAERLLDSECF